MEGSCGKYHLLYLIKDSICFKNPDEPPYIIDVILVNLSRSFAKSKTIQTGFSDLNHSLLAVRKIHYEKQKPVMNGKEV